MRTIKRLAYPILAFIAGAILASAGSVAAITSNLSPANLFKIGGTQIVPIDPTWSVNVPLSPPTNPSIASSTGSLQGGGKLYFVVAASNGTGTTTASNEVGTTTVSVNEGINVSWSAVPGATKYFVYFGTTTPGSEAAYFVATTSTAYSFTSTSSPTFGTPPGFPSSFAVQASNTATPLKVNNISVSPLATTTSAIGGSALGLGACAAATSTLTVGTVSSSTVFMTTPQKFPGNGVFWQTYALNSTQVVTTVCAATSTTPVSTQYNVLGF
jgi:hypothetical protein